MAMLTATLIFGYMLSLPFHSQSLGGWGAFWFPMTFLIVYPISLALWIPSLLYVFRPAIDPA